MAERAPMQFQTTMSRSQLCLCTFRPRRPPTVWCIKIPSAYVVAQAVRFLNKELRLNADAFCRSSEVNLRGGERVVEWAGPAAVTPMFAARTTLGCGKQRGGKIITVKMETWVLHSNTSGYSSCFCSTLWTTGLKSQSDLWMRSAYQPDCCFCCFPLPCACFLFVLLFKCCETDAEVSASKRCSVMGWACSVFGRRLRLLSPSGPAGENLTFTTPPVTISHCLISPLVQNIMSVRWSRVLSAWLSWRPAGAECSGSACLSKSSVDLCFTLGLACLCAGMCVSLRYLIVL